MPMGQYRIFLGLYFNLSLCMGVHHIECDVKRDIRHDIVCMIDGAMDSGCLKSGTAASLRGKCGWAATGMSGKLGRCGTHGLVIRQHFEAIDTIPEDLAACLALLRAITLTAPVRSVPMGAADRKPLVVYT